MGHQILFRGRQTKLATLPLGASRIAGPPDLPVGVPWPKHDDGRHLPLICQLALVDLAPFPAAIDLPANGTLLFFAAQQVTEFAGSERSNCPGAIVYVPGGAKLARRALPPESADEAYWDPTEVAAIGELRAAIATDQTDELYDDAWHVVFPVPKYSSAYGMTPPSGFTPILEMRSDDGIRMNWGDAAWATWILPEADLAARRFERATVIAWIG